MILLAVLQLGYFGIKYHSFNSGTSLFVPDVENQKRFDSLVLVANTFKKISQKPFNPNYISDFKAYGLGMSPAEIDRLNRFRAQDRFVNSAEEFQMVTEVSDSLLDRISPLFKFPDWVKNTSRSRTVKIRQENEWGKEVRDLNLASADDLRQVHGIGEKLSARIVKFRNRLNGFLINEQLYDVYGLEPEVVKRTLQQFQVLSPPSIKKININTANVDEIAALIYLRYHVAENIVNYREQNGAFTSLEYLFNVPGFPVNKIDRIGLYLSY